MRAKKSLGQHFLHDGGVLAAIADALELRPEEQILEIGPGTGRLTRALVARAGAERVVCVERDRDMVAHLAANHPDVRVVPGDAVGFPFEQLIGDGPAVVAANLPYNAAAQIYFHLLLEHRHRFRRMVLMFQKEVADRLVAVPGSKRFGPPSVVTTLLADAARVLRVPPRAFRPPPRVESAVIRVDPLATPRFGVQPAEVEDLHALVTALFRQRRKTILNNLKDVLGDRAGEALSAAGVDPQARSEALPVEQLVRLWRHVVPLRRCAP